MSAERLDRIRQESMDHFGFGPRAMRRCKVCAHCQTMSPASELFCRECGRRLPRDTLYQLYKSRHKSCPACDTVVSAAARYCPQCGTLLDRAGEAPPEGGEGL